MNKIWNITFCLLFQYLCIFKNNVSTNDITKEDKRNLRHRLGIDNFNIKADNNTIEKKHIKKRGEDSEKERKEKNSSNSHESSVNDSDNDSDNDNYNGNYNPLQSEQQTDTNFGVRGKTYNKKLIKSSIIIERTHGKNSSLNYENTIECLYPEVLVGGEENRTNSFDLPYTSLVTDISITPKCHKSNSDDSNHDTIIDQHETSQITSLNAPPITISDQKDISRDAVSEHEDPSQLSSDPLQVNKYKRTDLGVYQSKSGSLQLEYGGHHDGNDGVNRATQDRKKARPDKIKGTNQEEVEYIHDLVRDKVEGQEENIESDDDDETGEVTYDENYDSHLPNSLGPETSHNQDYSLSNINILNEHSDENSNMKNIDLENFKDTSITTKEEGSIVTKIRGVKEEEKGYNKYEKNILEGTKRESEKVYDLYDYILTWLFGPMKITETSISKENDFLELKERTSWDRTNIISENKDMNEETEKGEEEEEEEIKDVEQLNEIQGEITEDEVEEEKEENIEEEEYVDQQTMLNQNKIHDIEKKNKNEEKNDITKDIETTKYTVTHLEKYNNIKKEAANFFKTIIYLFSDYK